MGKATGFMEYAREAPQRRPVSERVNDFFEVYEAVPRGQAPGAGRALHGLRRALLPHRLPAEQPHPGLERPGLSRPLEGRHPRPARHQQFPRIHGPALPRAVRGLLRARHQRAAGHHQADREVHRRPRLSRGLDRARAAAERAPASASRWSARGRRAWPPRSS